MSSTTKPPYPQGVGNFDRALEQQLAALGSAGRTEPLLLPTHPCHLPERTHSWTQAQGAPPATG